MKLFEKILGGLIVLLMIFRLLVGYPYSAILITFSCLILSIMYLFLSFILLNNIRLRNAFKKESYSRISTLRTLGVISTGFVLSIVVIYSLFKFQLWPYGNDGLQIALSMLFIVFIVVLIKHLTTNNSFYSNFIIRLSIIGVLATILLFTPNKVLLELYYKGFPDYVEAEKKVMEDPDNENSQEKANEERMKMDLSDE